MCIRDSMKVTLKDGSCLSAQCVDPLGSPDNPLTKQQALDKVRQCFSLGLTDAKAELFIGAADQLSELEDARVLLDMVS